MNDNQLDRWLFFCFMGLLLSGIIMVYSASAFYAEKYHNNDFFYLKKQFVWLCLGIMIMVVTYKFPYAYLQKINLVLMGISLFLLLYLAYTKSGRWIHLRYINIQVSDVVRLSLVIFLADRLSRKTELLRDWASFLNLMFFIILFAGLIIKQPDFSSAFMVVIICMAILFISPIPFRYFLYSGLVLLPAAAIVIWTSSYKMARILAFLHPEQDMLGAGYQGLQSLISLGAGGISGVGFAQSSQKLFFLPEAHTDFIFSIIGEEWGLIGTLFIVSLFFIILWRGIRLTNRAPDLFSRYLAFGFTINLVLYGLVNMLVTVCLLPPTGLPLPFVSYGGSSMLASCLCAGFLLNISNRAYSPAQINNRKFSGHVRQNLENRGRQFGRRR